MLKHDGAIVKTIGDAVMAAFIKPADALKAAVEMQEYFNGHNPDSQLRLRITLHTGSCLAVNLNERLDYFGNTVNLTAKIQAVVGAGQVGFTQAVNDDPESAEFLRQKQLFVEDVPFEQKWSKRTMTVHRVGVS
jgi:class 3 adenylate cyclase